MIHRTALLAVAALALLVTVLSASGDVQASDPLWFKSVEGEWAVTSGVAADNIGKVLARGVPKRYIRYSIDGAEGFSIGRRSGRVSYDGTAISGEQVSITVTARDKNGEAASVSRIIEVSVTQPEPPPEESEQQSAPQQEPDTTAPTVTGLSIVSTPKAHGSYAAGETITIEVTFSESVTVTGVPCLLINVGRVDDGFWYVTDKDSTKRPAAYTSGSGTGSLRFSYQVERRDRERDGVGVWHYGREDRPLRLSCSKGGSQGTIRDAAGNDADLKHRYMWPDPAHKVGGPDVYPDDRTAPTITGLEVVSTPASGDTYRDREAILVRVSFSEPVVVKSGPKMGIWMGRYRKEMGYWGGTGTNQLTLGYRVRPEDRDGDGIATKGNMVLVVGDLAITDSADNPVKVAWPTTCERCFTVLAHGPMPTQPGHKVAGSAADTTSPVITKVSIAKSRWDYVYRTGEVIHLMIFFSEIVHLGDLKPTMEFTIGGQTRTAAYVPPPPHSPSFVMKFVYTVQEGDAGDVAIPANSLRPADAVLRDSHDNLTTSLAHPDVDAEGRTVAGSAD